MILVFNSLVVSSPVFGATSPVNPAVAASAAAEIANEFEWIYLVG